MKASVRMLAVLFLAAQLFSCKKDEPETDFITFEEIDLGSQGYWNGSDGSGGFESGNAFFPNTFNEGDGGDGWWTGFAVSNHKNRATPGYTNQYSCYAGGGANASDKFALVHQGDTLEFTLPEKMESIQVSNTTYAALSMKNGDAFAKKFAPGDYFRLVITGIDETELPTVIYKIGLADFTDPDENMHYISNVWNLIDLEAMGTVKKIAFSFESSDTSERGINTPAYACIDNIRGTLGE